jgi:hypothetical protein
MRSPVVAAARDVFAAVKDDSPGWFLAALVSWCGLIRAVTPLDLWWRLGAPLIALAVYRWVTCRVGGEPLTVLNIAGRGGGPSVDTAVMKPLSEIA